MRVLKSSLYYYKIDKLVGEGQNSRVYKATKYDRHTGLKNCVALKILKSKHMLKQWQAEFNTLSQVRSLYCVRVFDWAWLQSQPTLVLEYVDGPSLHSLQEHLSTACIYEVLRQVQLGLNDLRRHHLCHGDLSLHNIMLNSKGQVRLVDFGLANRDFRQLTPQFAAPEVLQGQALTSQSDLYSMGRVAQTLLKRLPPAHQKAWLHPVPEKRKWTSLTVSPLAQSSLMRAVHHWTKLQSSQTQSFFKSPSSNKAKAPSLITKLHMVLRTSKQQLAVRVCVLAVLAVMHSPPHHPPALLQVKGAQWKHINVDGQSLGYAPLNWNLHPYVTYKVGIQSHRGLVYKKIRLHPDEVFVISDSDE